MDLIRGKTYTCLRRKATWTGLYLNVEGILRAEMQPEFGSAFFIDVDILQEVAPNDEEIPLMKNSAVLVNALHENLNCVQVRFKCGDMGVSNKSYSYKTFETFEIGDEAVVDSPIDGLAIVVVVGLDPTMLEENRLKWVVQKINTAEYEQRVKFEDIAINNINRMMSSRKREEALALIREATGIAASEDNAAMIELLTRDTSIPGPDYDATGFEKEQE